MRSAIRRPWVRVVAIAMTLTLIAVVSFGLYLASLAGDLPWQEDPTRIPITPFADIPGFSLPGATPPP